MADNFRRVTPGNYWTPSAAFLNTLADMAEDHIADQSLSQQGINVGRNGYLEILNRSGDGLAAYGVCGIGNPITKPDDDESEFKGDIAFASAVPAPRKPFAIIQDDALLPGTIGKALMSGISQCMVYVNDLDHAFAQPIAGDYSKLESCQAPTCCEILWLDLPTVTTQLDGAIDDTTTTIQVYSADGFIDPDFVISIGAEDMLVTAVDDETWTVERGYNDTTPADHAHGSPVALSGGTVWAIVRLGHTPDEFIFGRLDGTSVGNRYGWKQVAPKIGGTFADLTGGVTSAPANNPSFEVNGAVELTKDRIVFLKKGFGKRVVATVKAMPAAVLGVDCTDPDGTYGPG